MIRAKVGSTVTISYGITAKRKEISHGNDR